MTQSWQSTQALIDQLVRETGCGDASEAIRSKATELINLYVSTFGDPDIPIDVELLASLRGISPSDELPVHSADAELIPNDQGGVTMRVNPDRPQTRKRFSIAHEISHTFFPNFASKSWCRPDPRYRDRVSAEDYLETLCDIGAAELLFPQPWFGQEAVQAKDGAGLIRLSSIFKGSPEATLRRFVETSPESLAVVYFTWKLKPTQKGLIGNPAQQNLFGISPEDELREALKLRIEYSVPSNSFREDGHFLPKDKSINNDGPIFEAAASRQPTDDECHLSLGQASGRYRVSAIPLWTAPDDLGPGGESSVAAVLTPISVRRPSRSRGKSAGPTLFE